MGGVGSREADAQNSDVFVQIEHYSGNKNRQGEREGTGVYCFLNGDVYDGQWKKGKKHGYGEYTYKDGRW